MSEKTGGFAESPWTGAIGASTGSAEEGVAGTGTTGDGVQVGDELTEAVDAMESSWAVEAEVPHKRRSFAGGSCKAGDVPGRAGDVSATQRNDATLTTLFGDGSHEAPNPAREPPARRVSPTQPMANEPAATRPTRRARQRVLRW